MTRRASALLIAVLLLGTAEPAAAHTLISELLLKALLSDVVLAPPTGPFASHAAHFQPVVRPGEVAAGFELNQLEIPLAINSVIAAQLSTIPVGSSSGGFAYAFDPELGTFSRKSRTFGSGFAERALTTGRGRWNVGFNFQRATYDSLEGKDLENGDIRVYLAHQDCCGAANAPGTPPDPFFEGDLVGNRLFLDMASSTFSAFLNYGVTDRLDVGVVVPVVTIDMDVRVNSRIIRLATASNPAIHTFPGGEDERVTTESARAQGLGDLLLRGKYRVLDAGGGGIAAGIDLRLPTGDADQLLGAGGMQAKVSFIGSMETGPFSPHLNIGYTFSDEETQTSVLSVTPRRPDEFSYAAGFDVALTRTLTFSADVLGRTLRDLGRLVPVTRQFPFTTQAGSFGVSAFEEFTVRSGDLTTVVGAAGVRFNPRGNLLISAQFLMPISEVGLVDNLTPVIGIDYSF